MIQKKTSFLDSLSEKNRIEVLKIGELKLYKKKDFIFHEEEAGNYFCLISKGDVQLSKSTEAGKEIVIKIVQTGEIFGEVILFERDTYPVTATALNNCEIFLFRKDKFLELLNTADFRNDFIRMLLQKQRYLTEQIKMLTTHDVEDRFFNFIFGHYGKQKEISVNISKKDIAAAIGTTPETLSRLIQKLTEEEKLSWSGKKIVMKK